MATQAVPDPSSLRTWDEAFQYPLPTVRKLSVRLHKNIDEHRSRLRSLVGASYRDLLGTAERIIEMDRQIQSVENGLSDIGRRCNSNIVERVDTNYTTLERSWSEHEGQDKRLQSLAQSKILTAALSVVSRLIRRGGEALQAAKLMVLTRLLYKSLSESEHASSMLERHRVAITTLRNKLLAYVDRSIGRKQSSSDDLSATLSAYALITSSSPKDVLKHFLAVRTTNIEALTTTASADDILEALSLYSATFTSVQTVFPKRLAETLTGLSKVTLLSDKQVRSVDELSLDVLGKWISEDVRTFTPWVQKDNLTAQEGKDTMSGFSSGARKMLLTGLTLCVSNTASIEAVLDIRRRVLGATLNLGTRIKFNDFMEQLMELREVFAVRLDALIAEEVAMKDLNIANARSPADGPSIWDLAQYELDFTAGGSHLRSIILQQRHGRDASLNAVLAPHDAWRSRVEQCWSNIKAVRGTKWDGYIEQNLDDVDDDDDEDTAVYHDMLSTDDSSRLQSTLYSKVLDATRHTFEQLHSISKESLQPQLLLRILREVQTQYLAMSQHIELSDGPSLLHHDIARTLHGHLAASLADTGIEKLTKVYSSRHFLPLDLWEGSPKLPSQPLSATFEYVLSIQQAMSRVGEDVWSAAAVTVLKQTIADRLREVLAQEIILATLPNGTSHNDESGVSPEPEANVENAEKETTDTVPDSQADTVNVATDQTESNTSASQGEDDTSTTADQPEDTPAVDTEMSNPTPAQAAEVVDLSQDYTQRLFDAIYISKVFETTDVISKLQPQLDILQQRCQLGERDLQRLHKQAGEYWKKTYLLLGLLAHTGTSYSK